MASSGTYGFTAPTDELLVEAWQRIGFNPAILTAEHAISARRSLQLMLTDWGNRVANLWQIELVALTMAPGVATVTLPARVVDVLDIYASADNVDLPLAPTGRSDYAAQTDKARRGRPTQVWVNRQAPAVVLNFFPVPDRAYSVSAYVLRQPQDIGALAQTPDAPVMWAEALASGLAVRLARKYKPELVADLRVEAAEAYANAAGENRERVPLSIMPDFRR